MNDGKIRLSKKMTTVVAAWGMTLLTVWFVQRYQVTPDQVEWAVQLIGYPTIAYIGGQSAVDAMKEWRKPRI